MRRSHGFLARRPRAAQERDHLGKYSWQGSSLTANHPYLFEGRRGLALLKFMRREHVATARRVDKESRNRPLCSILLLPAPARQVDGCSCNSHHLAVSFCSNVRARAVSSRLSVLGGWAIRRNPNLDACTDATGLANRVAQAMKSHGPSPPLLCYLSHLPTYHLQPSKALNIVRTRRRSIADAGTLFPEHWFLFSTPIVHTQSQL
ncbi:hypothetical protein B0J11DRAFT_181545 [Dendryphion nanum]|uniref:Uncharacterized protein n=1 Tax=Dendryphion nanum TaxID=256645 RepID=A0A9P9D590_9PLEO|nr:hypothetical protein B0J11DRAFT_181545 [Dendryphion nanum]